MKKYNLLPFYYEQRCWNNLNKITIFHLEKIKIYKKSPYVYIQGYTFCGLITIYHSEKLFNYFNKIINLYLCGNIKNNTCFFPYIMKQNVLNHLFIKYQINNNPLLYKVESIEEVQSNLNKLWIDEIKSLQKKIIIPSIPWVNDIELPNFLNIYQKEILNDIFKLFKTSQLIHSLIYGDVGSGKSLIILYLTIFAHKNNKKVWIIAPTKLLRDQLKDLFSSFDIPNDFITTNIHNIPSCDLYIFDEQHKFGFEYREQYNAHIVMFSATPIPRTLAQIIQGNTSLLYLKKFIDYEKKIYIINNIDSIMNKIIISKKKIAIVFHSLVQAKDFFNNLSITHKYLCYGGYDLEINKFLNSEYGILISTTVIEIGLNLNLDVIIIASGDYFGMAQIYQLIGRVGRNKPGTAIIVGIKDNLFYFKKYSGLKIATLDFQQRGFGNLKGQEQSGKGFFNYCYNLIEDKGLWKFEEKSLKEIILDIKKYIL